MMKYSSIIVLFFAMLTNIIGQTDSLTAQLFEKKSFTHDTTTINYRFFSPENLEKEKTYPLVISLHGAGERGDDNEIQIKWHRLATVWAEAENQQKHPCFVVSPQCPKENRWVDTDWKQSSYNQDAIPMSNELTTVYNLIKNVIKNYPIDSKRIYITGLSMGGYGTWDLITRHPELFAAAIPMSGSGDPSKASRIKSLPLWLFHGTLDKAVPVGGSRNMIMALQKEGREVVFTLKEFEKENPLSEAELKEKVNSGANLLYTEYKDKGHAIWWESYSMPVLREWLFSKSK